MRMQWKSAGIEELDLAIASVVPQETVTLTGHWASSRRRTYQSAQSRPGVGPFVDVLDMVWTGSLAGANPMAALVILAIPTGAHWVKSMPAGSSQPVALSLHSYADHSPDLATLAASVGDAYLPAVPVAYSGSPADSCKISVGPLVTGRVSVLASADRADILVLLIPASLIRIGRNRLWRLREEYAVVLPLRLRELLTRRRTGTLSLAGGDHRAG